MTTEGADTAPQKLEAMRELLEQGIAMVHLDPRKDGVQVPQRFRGDAVLRLNFAYGFKLPALTIDDEGIYAILNFQGERAGCNIPWSAVFALTSPELDHNGRLWPEDVPPEVVSELVAQASRSRLREVSVTEGSGETTRPDKPKPGAKPRLGAKQKPRAMPKPVAVPTPDAVPEPSGQAKPDDTPPPPRAKGHLRVVK